MQKLRFFTDHGICGYEEEVDFRSGTYDAQGWIAAFGDRIGSGTAPLPSGGCIDLSKFAVVTFQDEA